jgi:DNA-binding XRE family transcriptional regulator
MPMVQDDVEKEQVMASKKTTIKLRKPSAKLMETLSEKIRSHRKEINLSQEELAERCDLHRTYIGSVERGERNVTLSTLEVIAKALKLEIRDLF